MVMSTESDWDFFLPDIPDLRDEMLLYDFLYFDCSPQKDLHRPDEDTVLKIEKAKAYLSTQMKRPKLEDTSHRYHRHEDTVLKGDNVKARLHSHMKPHIEDTSLCRDKRDEDLTRDNAKECLHYQERPNIEDTSHRVKRHEDTALKRGNTQRGNTQRGNTQRDNTKICSSTHMKSLKIKGTTSKRIHEFRTRNPKLLLRSRSFHNRLINKLQSRYTSRCCVSKSWTCSTEHHSERERRTYKQFIWSHTRRTKLFKKKAQSKLNNLEILSLDKGKKFLDQVSCSLWKNILPYKRWYLINNKVVSAVCTRNMFTNKLDYKSVKEQCEVCVQLIIYMDILHSASEMGSRVTSYNCTTEHDELIQNLKKFYLSYKDVYSDESLPRQHVPVPFRFGRKWRRRWHCNKQEKASKASDKSRIQQSKDKIVTCHTGNIFSSNNKSCSQKLGVSSDSYRKHTEPKADFHQREAEHKTDSHQTEKEQKADCHKKDSDQKTESKQSIRSDETLPNRRKGESDWNRTRETKSRKKCRYSRQKYWGTSHCSGFKQRETDKSRSPRRHEHSPDTRCHEMYRDVPAGDVRRHRYNSIDMYSRRESRYHNDNWYTDSNSWRDRSIESHPHSSSVISSACNRICSNKEIRSQERGHCITSSKRESGKKSEITHSLTSGQTEKAISSTHTSQCRCVDQVPQDKCNVILNQDSSGEASNTGKCTEGITKNRSTLKDNISCRHYPHSGGIYSDKSRQNCMNTSSTELCSCKSHTFSSMTDPEKLNNSSNNSDNLRQHFSENTTTCSQSNPTFQTDIISCRRRVAASESSDNYRIENKRQKLLCPINKNTNKTSHTNLQVKSVDDGEQNKRASSQNLQENTKCSHACFCSNIGRDTNKLSEDCTLYLNKNWNTNCVEKSTLDDVSSQRQMPENVLSRNGGGHRPSEIAGMKQFKGISNKQNRQENGQSQTLVKCKTLNQIRTLSDGNHLNQVDICLKCSQINAFDKNYKHESYSTSIKSIHHKQCLSTGHQKGTMKSEDNPRFSNLKMNKKSPSSNRIKFDHQAQHISGVNRYIMENIKTNYTNGLHKIYDCADQRSKHCQNCDFIQDRNLEKLKGTCTKVIGNYDAVLETKFVRFREYRCPDKIIFDLDIFAFIDKSTRKSVYANVPTDILVACGPLDPRSFLARREDCDNVHKQEITENDFNEKKTIV